MKFISKYIFLAVIMFSGLNLFAQTKAWTLAECIDTAIVKNIQLNETQLTSKLNEINYNQARANTLPNFSITDGQNFNFHNYTPNSSGGQASYENISSNNAALNGTITLFNGFLLKNTIKQSKFIYDASNFDLEKMKNDITLNVVAAYLQVIYSYKTLEIAKNEVKNDSTQVEKTQKFVDAGKLAEGNLLQVQSQLTADKASAVNADNQLQLAKVALMQLMNVPVVDKFDVDSIGKQESIIESIIPATDIYNKSEGIMPEIKSADLVIKANEIGINNAQALAYPKLTLGGALKTSYSSSNSLYTTTITPGEIGYLENNPSQEVWGALPSTSKQNFPIAKQFGDYFTPAVSLNITIPILNNFQAKYGIAKAKINLQNSQLEEQAVKDQLRKNIEQAYTDFTASVKNYSAAKDNLTSEKRTYSDMEKKFNIGLVTATDFLIEKNNYERAQISVVQAKYTYLFKSKIIDFYLGKPLK